MNKPPSKDHELLIKTADRHALFRFHESIQQTVKVLVLAFDRYDFVIEWQNHYANTLLGGLTKGQQLPEALIECYRSEQVDLAIRTGQQATSISAIPAQEGQLVQLAIQWALIPHPIHPDRELGLCLGFPFDGGFQKQQDLIHQIQVYNKVLTKREKEIFQLVTQGHSTHQIAALINRSSHTIESHRSNIIKKFKVNRFQDLIPLAVYLGLLK